MSELDDRLARIEGLVAAIEASSDGATRAAARELTAAVLGLHAAALERLLASLPEGARPRALRVVGCEPLSLEPDEGEGLSAPVRAAFEEALCLVEGLARRMLTEAGRA